MSFALSKSQTISLIGDVQRLLNEFGLDRQGFLLVVANKDPDAQDGVGILILSDCDAEHRLMLAQEVAYQLGEGGYNETGEMTK